MTIADLRVPFVDVAAQHKELEAEILEEIRKVIRHGQFILGPEVGELEEELAAFCECSEVVAVGSGTDALILSLRALDIGEGDEVITAPNSFVASASAIAMVGAKPVFADVLEDGNIDPVAIRSKITTKTRAIMPVHLTGKPARMDAIVAMAQELDLYVVADAAQAIGALYQDKPVGSWGDLACFSLHPLKTLNACGDGGFICVRDPELGDRLRCLRNLGLENRDNCVVWSPNSRLDSIQAAIIKVKMRYLKQWVEKRRAHAGHYYVLLQDLKELRLPKEERGSFSAYHTFVIQAQRRDELQRFLEEQGIATKIHYPIPIHLQKVGQSLGCKPGDFPEVEKQSKEILSLPIYPELSEEQIAYVGAKIQEFYQGVS